jgi:hypothetical protein
VHTQFGVGYRFAAEPVEADRPPEAAVKVPAAEAGQAQLGAVPPDFTHA